MKDLTTDEMGFIFGQMTSLEAQYPKAKIKYSLERNEVLITNPLPRDFMLLKTKETFDGRESGMWE